MEKRLCGFYPAPDTGWPRHPLADLFVCVAHASEEEAEGMDRARSATEKFLSRRLETIPETTVKFRLNVLLPL